MNHSLLYGLNSFKLRLRDRNDELIETIDSKLQSIQAGLSGENRLEQIFNSYSWGYPIQVLMNVGLPIGGVKFQVDCLVITQSFVLVLESKNISGTLSFEQNPERLVRERNDGGGIDVFESPEIQVERNILLLEQWLSNRGVLVPVIGAVVFTSAQHPVILKEPKRIPSLFLKTIPVFLNKQLSAAADRVYLTEHEMTNLAKQINSESAKNQYNPFPLCARWKVDAKILKRGVYCEGCGQFGMKRVNAIWVCPYCNARNRKAHVQAIQEWFMLVSDTITNKECREFLGIDDRHIAKRLLKDCGLEEIGSTRGKVYKMHWNRE